MTKARRELAAAMPSQDLVIEVLDARMPASSTNPVLAELRGNKPCLKVLSKSDIADPAVTDAWIRWFESEPDVIAIALRSDRAAETRKQIADEARRLVSKKPIRALICGVPNVGKSTLINTLMNRAVAVVGDKPAVTKAQQQVVLPSGMVLWDSPGIMWPKVEDQEGALRLALAGSIPDTAIDYLEVATFGAGLLLERYPDRLLARFKLAQILPSPEALIAEIGRRRGCLRSGGVVDLHKAAEILVHELRSGGLGRISLETPDDFEQEPDDAPTGDTSRETPPAEEPS